ncbi:MAG: N-acetyltransferase family protein [Myxococcota bacterium]
MSSNTSLAIRPANTDDVPRICEIVRDTLLEHITASGGDEDLVNEEFLVSTMEQSSILVATKDERVVGYIQFQVRPPELVVNGAAVEPSYQKRGIGTELFRECVEDGNNAGCDDVVISVQPTNESIHALYLRMGFVEGDNPSGWNQTLSMPMDKVAALFSD